MYIPSLSDTFTGYLPWINLLGVISIVLDVIYCVRATGKPSHVSSAWLIEIAGIILAGIMLSGPSLIDFRVADLSTTPVAGSAETLVQLVQLTPKIILVILIIVQSVEACRTIPANGRPASAEKPLSLTAPTE